jgi:hypothetical protein
MTQGRRAADRRRQRAGGDDDDDGEELGTTPGALPVVPHDDYVEVDDESRTGMPLLSADESAEGDDGPDDGPDAETAARSSSPPARVASRAGAPRGQVVDEELPDAEKSFARELKRRPQGKDNTRSVMRPEVTEVKALKARRTRLGGQLVVVAYDGVAQGAAAGGADLVFPISVYPALIGRTESADIAVGEPTVSVRHAEIGYDPDDGTFSIADLGSTSGTLKNGVVVDGRVPLELGDVIAVGKTELRFKRADAAPGKRPPPAPTEAELKSDKSDVVVEATERLPERTSPAQKAAREAERRADDMALQQRRAAVRRKALLVIGASVVLLSSVAVITLVYRSAFSDAAPAQIRHQVSVLLAEAKKHLHEGDVDGAHARVETVLGLDPDNLEGQSLDRVITTERSARDALQLALRLGDEDRDDEALAALLRIADTSVFARDRDRLHESLASRALVRSLRIVENFLEQGRMKEALALATAHVKRFPDDEGGKALLARVQAAQVDAPKNPGLSPARAAFADGRLDEARAIARAAGFVGYAADVDRFEAALKDGQAALLRFDGQKARGPLDDAFRLLSSLGAGTQSPQFQAVKKPYVDALFLTGTEKLENGDRCGAARDLYRAARVSPDDNRLQPELAKLSSLADQGLQKARGAKSQDPERSAAIAREHLCLAKSGSNTYDELNALSR